MTNEVYFKGNERIEENNSFRVHLKKFADTETTSTNILTTYE